MGKMTYYDFAENDYLFLKEDYENGRVGNILCSTSQSICERYLKYIISEYCNQPDLVSVLHTHSLIVLKKFLQKNLAEFKCDWDIVMKANGYYYSTRYPGDDSFEADKEDVDECWAAVEEVRLAVVNFERERKSKVSDNNILEQIKSF